MYFHITYCVCFRRTHSSVLSKYHSIFFSLLFFPMIQSHATMHTVLFSDSMYCTPFLCQAQSNSLPRVCNTVHLCSQYSIYMATVVHPQKCLNNYLMRSNPFWSCPIFFDHVPQHPINLMRYLENHPFDRFFWRLETADLWNNVTATANHFHSKRMSSISLFAIACMDTSFIILLVHAGLLKSMTTVRREKSALTIVYPKRNQRISSVFSISRFPRPWPLQKVVSNHTYLHFGHEVHKTLLSGVVCPNKYAICQPKRAFVIRRDVL